jgi:orotate phosphoribosyltransferase
MEAWFVYAIGFVGLLGGLLIVIVVTVRSIFELWHIYGFFPNTKIDHMFLNREDRIISETLQKIGILPLIPEIKETMRYLNVDANEFSKNYIDATKAIVKLYLKKGKYEIGRTQTLPTEYYISLREALVQYEDANRMARIIISFIIEEIKKRRDRSPEVPIEIDMVVGHRDGSPLLASLTANLLNVPCILYGERKYVHHMEKDYKFTLDGPIKEGSSAILVDDSTTDGNMLISMANAMTSHKIYVKHAFVMFNREEGKANETLSSMGITLHSILPLTDTDLASMI